MPAKDSSLQLFVSPKIAEEIAYASLYEKVLKLNFKKCELGELDLKKFLTVICPLSDFEDNKKRFKYYKHVWFICLDDVSKDQSFFEDNRLFILSNGQESEIATLIDYLKELAQGLLLEEMTLRSEDQIREVSQEAERYLSLVYNSFKYQFSQGSLGEAKKQINEMNDFFLLRRELLAKEDLSEVFEHIDQKFSRWGITNFTKVPLEDLARHAHGPGKSLIVPAICFDRDHHYYVWGYDGLLDARLCFYIFNLILSLEKFNLRNKRIDEVSSEESLWEQAFQHLDVPMVLLTQQGDVLIHNNEFSRLGLSPRDCLKLKHRSKVEAIQLTWSVYREPLFIQNESYELFVFQTSKELHEHKNINSGELGIISGSIAHELNNPLGGILACLSLLELEENWSDEQVESLNDMQKGTQRCKDLVEIFLGFSKMSPGLNQDSDLDKAMNQALNLLRFRMIESNQRIDVGYSGIEKLDKKTNPSVMAMVFYLILSEILTSHAHLDLIKGDNSFDGVQKVTFEEYSDRISMNFDHSSELYQKILDSKLIAHLLDIEGFELAREHSRINLFRNALF